MVYRHREADFATEEGNDMTCEEDRLIAEVLGEPLPTEECPTDGPNANDAGHVPEAPAPAPSSVLKRLHALPLRAFRTAH